MRRSISGIVTACLLITPLSYAATRGGSAAGLSGGQITAEGFDKCEAPASSAMRSWLASPYRVVNIYMGGNNRACADQPELSPQWLTTVTSNGWSVIPTYVGSQASCTSSHKTNKISSSTAAAQGLQEADDAAVQMAALGLPAGSGNPVYFDMEPYNRDGNAACDNAVLTFLDAWTRELHVKGYLSGVYGTVSSQNGVIYSLVQRQGDPTFAEPDDIWYAHWYGASQTEHDTTTDEPILADYWSGHRIHQWRGGHNETFNGLTFNIDSDAVAGDVVTAVAPTPPTGPPYHYAAAPPAGSTLKERSTAETTPDNKTGVVFATGGDLSVECQTVGENEDGSVIWDKLSDGGYVADIFTTTTGGLTFTAGVPRCDLTPPVATIGALPAATLHAKRTITWSGTDDASGVKAYDVRYRKSSWNADLGSFHRLATATPTTSTRAPLEPGVRYCFQARAIDGSGNVSPWTADSCIARALDDTTLSGGHLWKRLTAHRYFRHTATATHSQGVTLHLHGAHVTVLGLVATTCPSCGSVDVFIKKHLAGTVSLHSSSRHERTVIMLKPFKARVGNVRITTKSTGLARIDGLVASG